MLTIDKPVMNPLAQLGELGQSVWLDYIRRSLIESGELKRLIEEDELKGVTTNPAIFEKAIVGSSDYSAALTDARNTHGDPLKTYETIAIADVQAAADLFSEVYRQSEYRDGYVSLEVSPFIANDSQQTLDQARRLWKEVDRPNVMIKVPATDAGIVAIEQLIGEGINVNATLIFSRSAYNRVAEAFISGLQRAAESALDLSRIASVASFFISRIDVAVDDALQSILVTMPDYELRQQIESCLGKVAIANAKMAYQDFLTHFNSSRWKELAADDAQVQRVLWASTGTKNPAFSDVLYVEELIGTDTVNTIPPATYDAFRAHGTAASTLSENVAEADYVLKTLGDVGVSLDEITSQLLADGLTGFSESFERLLRAVDIKCTRTAGKALSASQTFSLPVRLSREVNEVIEQWKTNGNVRRLWNRDATLWSDTDESQWLGWLGITQTQLQHHDRLTKMADKVAAEKFTHILLLGMGGSSLCPDVLKASFGKIIGSPELLVLDSTDPAQIATIESQIDLKSTLFIVSSKSGSTTEPNIFKQYFFEKLAQQVGRAKAGNQFIAVTDPGSSLEAIAKQDQFRQVFHGVPSIGGRYSALSDFGMVPAAAMGIHVAQLLHKADEMVHACSSCVPLEENPGAMLGIAMGVACNQGRNKLTIVASPQVETFGGWLEQLVAESTGKQGLGIVPVDRESLTAPGQYGDDRLFVYVRHASQPDEQQDAKIEQLEQAGHPVIRIAVNDAYDLGREFFRWEMATAVAGAVIGINPFNQPDVEASKIATRELTNAYESTGQLPAESPFFEESSLELFADEDNIRKIKSRLSGSASLTEILRAHLSQLEPNDYFGLLCYVEMNQPHQQQLQKIRHTVRDQFNVATVLGFGPRFLHSTGQAYKGGPDNGLFVQLTCHDEHDLNIPGQKFTFGVAKAAQARGDFQVLVDRGRRVLRIHLAGNLEQGLVVLQRTFADALQQLQTA